MADPFPSPLPAQRNAAILTAIGLDGPGILARLTGRVAALGGNVLDLQQTLIGRYFAITMLVDLAPARLDFTAFRDDLVREGETLGVRVLIAHEEAFRAMHRV
ncbi:MAG: hypothetical protein GEEBNDBF_01574 [bacterium]|nr:hypothetical protein [bacterium]